MIFICYNLKLMISPKEPIVVSRVLSVLIRIIIKVIMCMFISSLKMTDEYL